MKKTRTPIQKISIFIRSALVILVLLILFILLAILFELIRLSRQAHTKISRTISSYTADIVLLIFKYLGKLNAKIHFKDPLPTKPSLILTNHQNGWDIPFLVRNLPGNNTAVVKYAYKYYPIINFCLISYEGIFIKRESPTRSIRELKQGLQNALFKRCQSVILSPQGTRTSPEADIKFKPGAALMIKQLKLEKIVLVVHNIGVYLPTKKMTCYPGTACVLTQNVAINPDFSIKEINEFLEQKMREAIIELNRKYTQ